MHRLLEKYGITKELSNQEEKWTKLCKSETLTEKFIKTYKDYVNWAVISANQKFSEEFIE